MGTDDTLVQFPSTISLFELILWRQLVSTALYFNVRSMVRPTDKKLLRAERRGLFDHHGQNLTTPTWSPGILVLRYSVTR